jgi:hypothetical protein
MIVPSYLTEVNKSAHFKLGGRHMAGHRDGPAIYFLITIDNPDIVYVGQSRNVCTRVKGHGIRFDYVLFLPQKTREKLDELERFWIQSLEANGNCKIINRQHTGCPRPVGKADLPKYIRHTKGGYVVRYVTTYLGTFNTLEEAKQAIIDYKEERNDENASYYMV